MHPSKTILVKAWQPNLDDDLSTLSGNTEPSFSRKNSTLSRAHNKQPPKPHHTITPAHSGRKTKDKLQSYTSKSYKKSSSIPISIRNPLSVPFDEVPMAVRLDFGAENLIDHDDDDNSMDDPEFESWEVHADGSLELAKPLPQNTFEKSKKSAFVSMTAERNKCHSTSTSPDTDRSPSSQDQSSLNKIKQTRLDRLRKRRGAKLLSSKMSSSGIRTEKLLHREDKQQENMTIHNEKSVFKARTGELEQNMTKFQRKLEVARTALQSHRKLLDEIATPEESNDMACCINAIIEERVEEEATSVDDVKNKNRTTPTTPLSPCAISENDEKCKHHSPQSFPKNNLQLKSPGSFFSHDTYTTECTSTTSPSRKHGYTLLNNIVMKNQDMFQSDDTEEDNNHGGANNDDAQENKKGQTYSSQTYSSPKTLANTLGESYNEELNFDNLSSPPILRRRSDISLLAKVSDDNMSSINEKDNNLDTKWENITEKASICWPSTPKSNHNNIQRDNVNIEHNQTQCEKISSHTSIHSSNGKSISKNEKCHTINFSVTLSGKKLPALQEIVDSIKKDLEKYQLNDDYSIQSIQTSCNSDCDKSTSKLSSDSDQRMNRISINHGINNPISHKDIEQDKKNLKLTAVAFKSKDNEESDYLLSMSSDSFLTNFRQAVDSLQNPTPEPTVISSSFSADLENEEEI